MDFQQGESIDIIIKMILTTFILACYGMTMIAVYGSIFNKVRPKTGFLGKLFNCAMCTGFWVGVINSFLLSTPFNFFIAGCISSGTSYFLSRLVDDEGILFKVKRVKGD